MINKYIELCRSCNLEDGRTMTNMKSLVIPSLEKEVVKNENAISLLEAEIERFNERKGV